MNSIDRISVLVSEPDKAAGKAIRELFVRYSMRFNVELAIDWLAPDAPDSGISSAACDKNITFINAGSAASAARIGERILARNIHCPIYYYGSLDSLDRVELLDRFDRLFPSRPIGYLETLCEQSVFAALGRCRSGDDSMFVFNTKGVVYRTPCEDILYFKSDRSYISLVLVNGKSHVFMSKMSMIESALPDGAFIRVHQSYLVNKRYIALINKTKRCVVLSNGEEIYISKAHYKDVNNIC